MKRSNSTLFGFGFKKTRRDIDTGQNGTETSTTTSLSESSLQSPLQAPPETIHAESPRTCTKPETEQPDTFNSPTSISRQTSSVVHVPKYEDNDFAIKRIKELFLEFDFEHKDNVHNFHLCQKNNCFLLKGRPEQKKDKFQHSWLTKTELSFCLETSIWWLVYEEDVGMFCVLCRKHDTCNTQNKSKVYNKTPATRYKKKAVETHASSDQHRAAIQLELTSRSSVFLKEVEEKKSVADDNLKAAFFALYWLMTEEVSNSKFQSLMLLAEKMGHPSIKHFRYTGAGTLRDMMLTIGQHIRNGVAEKVRNSGAYGLLVDEVTDISVKQQMVCFVQYIDGFGLGHVDLLGIANVLDFGPSADAETLLKCIRHILSMNDLDITKCTSFVSDGASVMVGKINGVAAKLKNIVPTLLSVHCVCHRLALACTDTNKEIEYISTVERILTQLWKYFDDSPKRSAALLKTQLEFHHTLVQTGDIPKQKRVLISRKMKKACKTRWLSFDNSVKSAFGEFPAVLQTLRVLKLNDDPTADGLLRRMRVFKFVGALALLSHVLPILASLSKSFQKGTLNFAAVQPAVEHTLDSLTDLLPTDPNDVFTSQVCSDLKTQLGENGRLKDLELTPSDFEWNQLTNLLLKYINALKENINARFSTSLPILQCFSIFDPSGLPLRGTPEFKTFGNESVKTIADHFYQGDEAKTKEDKTEKLLAEWGNFKYILNKWRLDLPVPENNPDQKLTALTPLEWSLQRMLSNHHLMINYQELLNIAKIIISMPVSNAWPERGGSAIKRIKTRLRNSIKNDMLCSLLQVAVNGPEVQDADQVVKESAGKWVALKKRTKLCRKTLQTEPCEQNENRVLITEEAGVQTDLVNDDLVQLEAVEKKQNHVMNLMKQASKILGFQMDAADNDDDDEFEDDDDDLFEYEHD